MEATEIIGKMEQFTQSEKERLNVIATESNEDALTFADLELYARFKVSEALASERFEMEREQMQAVTKAKIEGANEVKRAAVERMHALTDLSKAKLAKISKEGGEIGEISK